MQSFGATLGWVVPLSETVWTQIRCLGFSSAEPPAPNEPYRDTTIPELACNPDPCLSAQRSKPSSKGAALRVVCSLLSPCAFLLWPHPGPAPSRSPPSLPRCIAALQPQRSGGRPRHVCPCPAGVRGSAATPGPATISPAPTGSSAEPEA